MRRAAAICFLSLESILYGLFLAGDLLHAYDTTWLKFSAIALVAAAGLLAGMQVVERLGISRIAAREAALARKCAAGLEKLGMEVFSGENQGGTVSFRAGCGCEEAAQLLSDRGFALRAGLHCAPLAHESAGTADTGTVRVSFGWHSTAGELSAFLRAARSLPPAK